MKKKVLIIGPDAGLGGVKTHVDILNKILSPYSTKIIITWGTPFLYLFYLSLFFRPHIVIYNLSIYRNKVLKDIIVRTLFLNRATKHILHLHGGDFQGVSYNSYFLWRKLVGFHLKRFHRIFCLTQNQFSFVSKYCHAQNQVQQIYNYIKIPEKAYLKDSGPTLNLLFIGRLDPRKGILEAIDAVNRIKEKSIIFWVIGTGELENVVAKKQSDQIKFLGPKLGAEKDFYLQRAHVMILPSRAESFPYVLLEGAANGLALLSTRVGSVEEILKNERNGFFIDPDNIDQISAMIKRFADDRDLVNAMGAYSKDLCKTKFPLSRIEDVYKKMLTE